MCLRGKVVKNARDFSAACTFACVRAGKRYANLKRRAVVCIKIENLSLQIELFFFVYASEGAFC